MSESAINGAIVPRSKWWWLGLALILLLAGWLYLRGYNVSLPYLDQVDEPLNMLEALHIIDFGHARGVSRESYPPGLRSVIYLVLKHIKPADTHYIAMVPALRLLAIAAWMLATVFIALVGAMIARPWTGLMAAVIWTVNPWVVERVRWVLPDGYLTLFTLLAIWLALAGTLQYRRSYCTAAVYSIMLATVFKTQAILIAPFIVLLPLLNWRAPSRRNFAWQQTFWNCVRFGIFLCWLLILYPTLDAPNQIYYFSVIELNVIVPSPDKMWRLLKEVLLTFQPLESWLLMMLGCGLLWLRGGEGARRTALATIVLMSLAWLSGSHILPTRGLQLRQFFGMGAMLAILFACGLTGWMVLLDEASTRLSSSGRSPLVQNALSLLPAGVISMLAVVSLLPSYHSSDALARNFTLHDRRNDLMAYMDTSLPPGKYISDYDGNFHRVMDRLRGVYRGLHDYPLARRVKGLKVRPIDEWRDHDAVYAIVPYSAVDGEPFLRFPEETFALKHYPTDPNFRDPGMIVLRLYPMQHKADGQLGGIRLVGYDLNASEVAAGEDIMFRHYWRADSPTNVDHHVFNHLLDEDGAIVAQFDYVPLWDGRRPTTTWDDPDEILLGREFSLSLPVDLPPGRYRLISGLYDPLTSQRLTSPEWIDHIHIADIIVTQPEVPPKSESNS